MGLAAFQLMRARIAARKEEEGEKSPSTLAAFAESPVAEETAASPFVCPTCGKDCKIKMAFTNHVKACKG